MMPPPSFIDTRCRDERQMPMRADDAADDAADADAAAADAAEPMPS